MTFDDFEEYGVHRHLITRALAELEALGFVVKTIEGRGGNAADRKAHQFRLTCHKFKEGGTTCYEGTNEWQRRAKTIEEALAIAKMARDKATQAPGQRRRMKTFPSGRECHSPVAGSALQNGGSQWQGVHCSPVAGPATTYNIFHPVGGDEAREADEAQPSAAPVQVIGSQQPGAPTTPDGTVPAADHASAVFDGSMGVYVPLGEWKH